MPTIAIPAHRLTERRSRPRDTVTDHATLQYFLLAPAAGYVATMTLDSNDPAIHVVVGVLTVLVSALCVPLVRWMIRRLDRQSVIDAKSFQAREEREDRRLELHDKQVQALTALVGHVELLVDGHREVLARLDKITNKLSGDRDEDEDEDEDT